MNPSVDRTASANSGHNQNWRLSITLALETVRARFEIVQTSCVHLWREWIVTCQQKNEEMEGSSGQPLVYTATQNELLLNKVVNAGLPMKPSLAVNRNFWQDFRYHTSPKRPRGVNRITSPKRQRGVNCRRIPCLRCGLVFALRVGIAILLGYAGFYFGWECRIILLRVRLSFFAKNDDGTHATSKTLWKVIDVLPIQSFVDAGRCFSQMSL